MDRALILVDIQNDFLPGGALAVPGGDEVVPVSNRLLPLFELVVATQDWHPANHGSFAANHPDKEPGESIELDGLTQLLWPVHCVQNSHGADFAPGLRDIHRAKVFRKGTDAAIDSYSGFFDNGHRQATGLGEFLIQNQVQELFVMGLATDYCVKFTAIDGCQLGFKTNVIEDGCRAVNRKIGDDRRALEEIRRAGGQIVAEADVDVEGG